MANLTNETFLEELERDYPGMDWDAVPSADNAPDVWKITGMAHRRLFHKDISKDCRDTCGYGIDKEYTSLEEAETALKKIIENSKEELIRENIYVQEYLGPVIVDTMKVYKTKPWKDVNLELMKSLREDVLKGEKVFPMYLP